MTVNTSVPWPFQLLQELSFLVTSAVACMLVITYVPVLFLFMVSAFFFVSLFGSTDSLTHPRKA